MPGFESSVCRLGYTEQIKIEGIAQLESGLELAEGDNWSRWV